MSSVINRKIENFCLLCTFVYNVYFKLFYLLTIYRYHRKMNWELVFNLITAVLVMMFTWWLYRSDGFPDGRQEVEQEVGLSHSHLHLT